MQKLTIHPGTPDLWLALRDLFGEKGACGGCWCMYWRIGNEYRRRSQEANRADLHEVVTPPGLIAFDGELAVGWCQLTPRALLPWLDRAWQRIDDLPVWSISCFYVRKEYRRQGITSALIQKAIETARKAGVPSLEGYPLDADLSPSATGTGYVSTFLRAGFRVVGRRSHARPILRLDLRSDSKVDPPATPLALRC
ncbi:MAG TPA: GNAT family N-acetyltransferase [Terriglobales bacterium]|nr:GNAT family N-acetyltransferase [Terriglobales bacterium]